MSRFRRRIICLFGRHSYVGQVFHEVCLWCMKKKSMDCSHLWFRLTGSKHKGHPITVCANCGEKQ